MTYSDAVNYSLTMKMVIIIFFNFLSIYFPLLTRKKDCYAPVELAGIICIIPEIIVSIIFAVPIVIMYGFLRLSTIAFIANGAYLVILWLFRHKIIETMNKFF